MTDKTVHNAPDRIFLQVCDDADCETPFQKHYEVSWSASPVGFEYEPEYVRVDKFDELRAENERLNKRVAMLEASARFKELGTNPPDDCPCGSQCVTISCCLCQCAEGKALKEAEG